METYSLYNLTVVLFAAFGSLFTGYSLAVFAFTLGQPTFYASLGLINDATSPDYAHTNAIIGAANGVFFGAGFCGCFLSGWVGDRFGRVSGFRVAAVTGVIGGALQTGSQSQAMFLVARFVAGLAAGHTMAAMPTYFAEVSPPHSRGLITGAHGIFINIGYMLGGWTGFGCYFAPNTTFAWRFPFALVCLFALCLLGGSFYVPESPRYLVQKDRHNEALEVLVRLHRDPSDLQNTFANEELNLIQTRCRIESDLIARDGRWRLFTKKENRRRLFLAWMVMLGGQNIGPLVINNYNVRLYGSLGLSSTVSILLSAVYNTIGFIIALIGGLISDKLGRRRAMLTGYILVTCVFAVLTGFIAKFNETQDKGWAAAAVTMVYLFVVCYNSFIDLNQFTFATEIFPTHIRNEGTGFAISGLFLADVLWLDLLPTATAAIGWKYYLVFACLAVLHTAYLFFFLPETGGWHLEEMDNAMAGAAWQHKPREMVENDKADVESQHIDHPAAESEEKAGQGRPIVATEAT